MTSKRQYTGIPGGNARTMQKSDQSVAGPYSGSKLVKVGIVAVMGGEEVGEDL